MTEVKHHLSSAERLTLIQTLNALPGPQFDELVFALNPPPGNISSNSAPQGSRSAALLQWVESPIGPGLADLKAVLTSFVGSTTTATPQPAPQQQTVEALIDIIKALSQNQAPKYDLRGAQFAGGFAETVQDNQVGGSINSAAQLPTPQKSQKAHPETEAQQSRARLLRQLKSDINSWLDRSLREWVKIDLRMEDQRQRVGKHKLELVPEDTVDTQAEASRSFTNRVFQPLGTQETPATTLEATQSLLPILKRSDVQDRLLILGEPGAGKTTELVALAYDLLVQAEQYEYSPIPIIFELSAWQENIPIEQWIVAQIKKVYNISESISQQWINDEQLMPLLDGLDELGLVKQKQCVTAINQFLEEKIYPYAVVCCRREEYEKAQAELSQLRGAIYLQPLTDEQIQGYLGDLNRFSLWNSIRASPELLDLSRRPLFLTMVVVAYQGQPIRNESDLFNVYIEKQLQDLNHQGAYPPGKAPSYPPGKAPSQQKTLTGDKVPRELAASGIEHRNRAENRAVYGA
jgi:hypothetical protein